MFKASIFASLAIALCSTAASAAQTGIAGGGQPYGNYQSSLAISFTITRDGFFPSTNRADGGANVIGGKDDALGSIHMFAGGYAPAGTSLAAGQLVSIAQNQDLFQLLGTNYGGNGASNFALPALQGRSLVGAGGGGSLSKFFVGQTAGQAQIALSLANMPDHNHDLPGGGQTSSVGGSQAYDSRKPSLGITYMIQTTGTSPIGITEPVGDGFVGQIEAFAGDFVPQGFAAADGRLLGIAGNATLFAVLGNTYGGDGITNFRLPDLRGRSAVGAGQSLDGSSISLGQVFGRESTALDEAELPAHVHDLPGGGFTNPDGKDAPVDNYGPSLGLNYIISTTGRFPQQQRGDGETDFTPNGTEPSLGEISLFAGNFAPTGWALANGQLLSISQNEVLFTILGTQYGGDGNTTFALPDFRGRTAIGTGATDFGDSFGIGRQVGANSFTLGVQNLPPHAHEIADAPAVPEPATWGLLIVGFGLIGGAMRRRRTAFA